MLQRIQTVFLLLVIASMVSFIFIPQWTKYDVNTGETHQMQALYYMVISAEGQEPVYQYAPFSLAGILAVAAVTIAFLAMFKFKNRVLQLRLGLLNSLFIVATLGMVAWFWYSMSRDVLPHAPVSLGFGLGLPAIAMVFNRLALRFIKKDEELVRSVDRIR